LTNADARKLLAEHGPNALKEAKPISPWVIFFAQFKSVVIWVLIGAGALSGLLGEAIDAFAIFAIVILNAVVGFYQEFSAEKSISALMRMTAPRAKVRRDGAVTSVAATDLVPGDILELEPGDVVAADARLLNASSLTCVEAMLTGESEAVAKSAETLDQPELPLGDRKNMIFMGTSVAAGSGLAVVVATGMQTEIGGIATLIGDAGEDKETPLQRKLEAFGRILLWATLAIVVLLFGLGLARGREFFELFLTSVSLAVAALPESLPAVVTAALSIGVLRMSRRRALVRRLASVETLGSTNVICTDKTGTLTVGQMTVRALFVAGQTYEVTGEGYGPEGDTRIEGKATDDSHATPLRQMAEILIGCNNAHLERINGTWNVIGDPTEGALLSAGHKAGGRRDELERDMPKHHEIPFDSDRKRHSVVRLLPDGRQRAFVNGAPEMLLARQHSELLARFFKTARMSYQDGLILLGVSALPLIVLEIIKSFQRYAVPDWGAEDRAGGAATPSAVSGRAGTRQDARTSGLGWQIAAAAGVVLLALGGGWLTWSLYQRPAAHYVTQKIERGSVVRFVTTSGTVNSATIARVEPHVSGVIQALYCDVNMSVTAGQLCAKLDARPYQTVMDQAKADLAEAETRLENDKVNLAQAQTAFERNEALAKRRAISRKALNKSRKTFDRAQSQMKRGEATVAQLQTVLHAAEINLGDTGIVSPIDGTVIARNVEVGQTAAAGSKTPPLFLVAPDLTVIHIDANVGETDISKVKQGAKVSFTVEAFPNRPFAGEVIQIGPSPRIIQNVAAYDVVIHAPNPDLLLKPGMMATIGIVIDQRDDVFRVPNQALRYSPRDLAVPNASGEPTASLDGWSRLWILRGGKPTAITVRLGLDDGAYTEIVEGEVWSGDELIIGGSGGVLEKQKP